MQPTANNGLLRLISILILAGAMLAAATPSLHSAWTWLLAPVALLAWVDLSSAAGPGATGSDSAPKRALQVLPFYAVLFGIAFAFHQFGPPAADRAGHGAIAGCGSGGCSKAGGCGNGGCGASSGGGCSCGSGAKAASAPASTPAPAAKTPA